MTVASAMETPTKASSGDIPVGEDSSAKMKRIYSDTNNNEIMMGDDESVSDKELKQYMEHYDQWKQSAVGKWLQDQLADKFGWKFGAEIKWKNVALIGGLHIATVVLFFVYVWESTPWTWVWGFVVGGFAGFGVTAGAHRLWTHRAYKAKLPLRIILMICFCMSGHNSLYQWVRDHRIHHKYSETDADPHNSNRGFFYAHVGWLMLRKHPECIKKGRLIDMTDLMADPVVQFHQKYFPLLKTLFTYLIPSMVPWYFFGEGFVLSFLANCLMRNSLTLNFTWLVNSAAHMYGDRPYDNRIRPVENKYISIVAMGEGWHNYHHVFPWDYKAAELGNYRTNITTFWLDLFAKIGWAYDLKEPSKELVQRTIDKYGDGTYITTKIEHLREEPDPYLLKAQ
ncbi:acyl-CoA Delta-9 desaturase-like [Malaya genurostris]|uniref:acyl-CoA Delta-9 desaturase-like n=1 Tax=Malaya genurostris TaxID=325434 RepID=UPI0026F40279|nr:acyl-CoA Delta-9 desaturase-like [Malaya genurostris]XP_058453917.1 acyl-CoA Delta-9 desaturase-like [Malaya genurostris]